MAPPKQGKKGLGVHQIPSSQKGKAVVSPKVSQKHNRSRLRCILPHTPSPPSSPTHPDRASDSEEIDQATILNQSPPKTVSVHTCHDYYEKNFRPAFESLIGDNLVRQFVTKKGWQNLLGSTSWFVNVDYVNWFRRHLFGTSPRSLQLIWQSEDGRVHKRSLTPRYLSKFTGIPPVDGFTWEFFDAYDRILTPEFAKQIAPYHVVATHYNFAQNYLRTKGMQENIMLLTKWLSLNVVGSYTIDKIHGRVAWLVDCFLRDAFPPHFDIHCVLLSALWGHTSSGNKRVSCPLPALVSAIAAKCMGRPKEGIVPKPASQRYMVSYKSDISGWFDGVRYKEGDADLPQVRIGMDGANLNLLFGKKKVASGSTSASHSAAASQIAPSQPTHPSPAPTQPPQPVSAPPPPFTAPPPPFTAPQPTLVHPFHPSMVSYDSYFTPNFIANLPVNDQITMLWNQAVLGLHGMNHLFSHFSTGFPSYPGFTASGFAPTTFPVVQPQHASSMAPTSSVAPSDPIDIHGDASSGSDDSSSSDDDDDNADADSSSSDEPES